MNHIVKQIILGVVKLKCNHFGKKSKETDEHFLDMFILFLKDYTKWKCLDFCTLSKYTSDNYRKKFHYWVRMGVFNDAYDIIYEMVKNKLVNHKSVNCFIDATNIRNINGSYKNNLDENGNTLLGRLYCDKFKRGLKVTILLTEENYPLDVKISNGGSHDITIVPEIKEKLIRNFKSNKKHRVNIVGDKGYTSNVIRQEFEENKMHYIVPNKTNSVTKDNLTSSEKSLLDKRHKIENYFAHIKQYSRLRLMYDKYVYTYLGFLYLGILTKIPIA